MTDIQRIRAIDSHTEGEPTRIVVEGGPDLRGESLAEYVHDLRTRHKGFRSAVVNEPRGNDAIVGGLLCQPCDPSCDTAVIFFNNVDYLNMCVHGSIGFVVTLAHLGRLTPGSCRIETPVGVITGTLHENGSVTVANVPSWRYRTQVEIDVPDYGRMTGDIAWGGNWFFLVSDHGQSVAYENIEQLTHCAKSIRRALERDGVTGDQNMLIDHIELFAPPQRPDADSKNFVLCPGGAYDRSPCGTGTSAKLACLWADGKLKPGESWRQESILGTSFEGSVTLEGDTLTPHITGSAYVNAELDLLLNPNDPFRDGISM